MQRAIAWRYSRVRHLEEKGGGAMRQFLVWLALCASSGISWAAPDFRARPPEDEIVYFVLPADQLPAFMPGHDAEMSHVRLKHGVAAAVVGVILLAIGWFVGRR